MKVGDIVYYTDITGYSTGEYEITKIDGEIYTLDNGYTELQAYKNEIEEV